ncbi:MAG: hypothetical protein M3294_09225 [Pseudomonadota bacterium]|nr:hypothetical protein [Pseudomonadota bacterium]
MSDKSDSAREALSHAAQRASEAGKRLVEIGSAMQEKAQDALRVTRRSSQDYSNRVRDYVADYPLVSIGIALVIGALASVLFSSRR